MSMNIIRDLDTFDTLRTQVCRLVDIGLTVPSRVFINKSWDCGFCSFDLCFSPDLLRSCSGLCEAVGDDSFWFSMVDPDPVKYYYKEFGRFGAVKIQKNEDVGSVWSAFEEDPGGSPADALMYAVRRFVVISPSMRWAVWGTRDDELIICGTENAELLQAFSKSR